SSYYCGCTFATFARKSQVFLSASMRARITAGSATSGNNAMLFRNFCVSDDLTTWVIHTPNFSTIGTGGPGGKYAAHHGLKLKFFTPASAIVGTLGMAATRCS